MLGRVPVLSNSVLSSSPDESESVSAKPEPSSNSLLQLDLKFEAHEAATARRMAAVAENTGDLNE